MDPMLSFFDGLLAVSQNGKAQKSPFDLLLLLLFFFF